MPTDKFDHQAHFAMYRSLGKSKKDAAELTFVDANKHDEARQIDSGVDYTEQEVRLAIVHTRQDMALLCFKAGLIYKRIYLTNVILLAILLIILIKH
jgi:hypothetical protein